MKIKVLHEARVGSRKPPPYLFSTFPQLNTDWKPYYSRKTAPHFIISHSPHFSWKQMLRGHCNLLEIRAFAPYRRLCSAEGRCDYSRGSTLGHVIFMNYHHLLKPSTFLKFPKITIGVPISSFSKTVGDIG